MQFVTQNSRKVLLVGGAGYIGPVIADELLVRGYQARCLDLLLYDNGHSLISGSSTKTLNLSMVIF